MAEQRWHVCCTKRDLEFSGEFSHWFEDWDVWLDLAEVEEGAPYLLSPTFEYDVDLNSFFHSADMDDAPENTQMAYARDMAGFFTFIGRARGGKGWREATEADHMAYKAWRTRVLRRAGSTWAREVATVSSFYMWAWTKGPGADEPNPTASHQAGTDREGPQDAAGDHTSDGSAQRAPGGSGVLHAV